MRRIDLRREVKSRLVRGSFSRNVLTLMVGTVAGQLVPVLISPLVTRLYTPADIGTYTLFMSVAMIAGVVAAGRYEMAVMLPRRDADAVNLTGLAIRIALAVTSASAIPLFVFREPLAGVLKNAGVAPWLVWAAPAALGFSAFQIYTLWLNRKNKYRAMTASRIGQALIAAACMLGIGWLWKGPAGLILAFILSNLLPAAGMAALARRHRRARRLAVSAAGMRAQARRYAEFPRVNAPHAFLDQVQANGVVFLISALFNSTVLGWYGYTMRILRTPLLFIGRSVSQVFYQKASETLNAGRDLHGLVKRAMATLVLIGLPIFGLIFVAAPEGFALVFGEKWRTAGTYARILSPWLFFNFVSSSLSQLPLLVDEQRRNFAIGMGYNGLLMACILAGYWAGDIRVGFGLVSVLLSAYVAGTLAWYLRIARKAPSSLSAIDPGTQPVD
jgi:O-antigen/teichoic acid export membrane protein